MSYTPTEWATGDTVTAEKLNKLENGVQEAGELPKQSGIVTFEVTTTNFPNSGEFIGYFIYARKVGDDYVPANMLASPSGIDVVGNRNKAVWASPLPVPTIEDLYLVFIVSSSVDVANVSGDISEDPVSVTGYGQGYIITGDFSIEFTYLG